MMKNRSKSDDNFMIYYCFARKIDQKSSIFDGFSIAICEKVEKKSSFLPPGKGVQKLHFSKTGSRSLTRKKTRFWENEKCRKSDEKVWFLGVPRRKIIPRGKSGHSRATVH